MRRIDIYFLGLAALCLIGGVAIGIGMGIAHDFQFAPVHAHLNLVGWTSLALFGLTYRAYPVLAQTRLARLHFALAAPSAVLLPAGIYVSIAHGFPGIAIAAALMWFAGVLLFAAGLMRLVFAVPERMLLAVDRA